jgi:hypothetical protein
MIGGGKGRMRRVRIVRKRATQAECKVRTTRPESSTSALWSRADRQEPAYSVKKLRFHAGAKNLRRYGATGSRSADGLPPNGNRLARVLSFCPDENLHAIFARDARLPRKCSHRETEFFNKIGHFRSYDRSGNRDANDRFQSTAAIGRRPLEWARSPKQSLTVLRP